MVLTKYLFENSNANLFFMIIKDESYYSVQDKVLSDDNKFLLIFK